MSYLTGRVPLKAYASFARAFTRCMHASRRVCVVRCVVRCVRGVQVLRAHVSAGKWTLVVPTAAVTRIIGDDQARARDVWPSPSRPRSPSSVSSLCDGDGKGVETVLASLHRDGAHRGSVGSQRWISALHLSVAF
eukprot:5369436-Pleurochrysis_carterae.AAC.2